MWRNYWTVAVRALAKNRTYSIINIAGLAIGMAACLLILLYIRYEQSYDSWLPDVENTYQLQTWYPHPQGRATRLHPDVALCRPRTRVKKDFPQVDDARSTRSAALRSSSRTARRRRPRIICSPTTISSRSSTCRCSPAPHAQRRRPRSSAQSEAIKRFGTDQVVGQTLYDDLQGHDARFQDHRRVQGPAEEFAA